MEHPCPGGPRVFKMCDDVNQEITARGPMISQPLVILERLVQTILVHSFVWQSIEHKVIGLHPFPEQSPEME